MHINAYCVALSIYEDVLTRKDVTRKLFSVTFLHAILRYARPSFNTISQLNL